MRTITKKAIAAFAIDKNFRDGATAVESDGTTTVLILHGNTIARKSPSLGLQVNLCGWNTPTTRERLNGLPNVSVSTKQGQAYLNGNPIDSNGWHSVTF